MRTSADECAVEIKARWPSAPHADPSPDLLALSAEAVARYPTSADLLLLWALLLQIAPEDYQSSDSPESCFKRAFEVAPTNAEVWIEFGWYLELVRDQSAQARDAFEHAVALGGGDEARLGLATSLAYLGRRDEGLRMLPDLEASHVEAIRKSARKLREDIYDGFVGPE